MAGLEVAELYTLTHHYRLPKKMGGYDAFSNLGVYLIVPGQKMLKALGHGEFATDEVEIPRGKEYVFKLVPDGELKKYVDVEEPKPKIEGALEFQEWLDHMKSKELTVADIEAMKPGEQLQVIQLHRNLGDMVLDESVNPYGVAIPAAKFFEPMKGVYTHDHDLHGRFLDVPDECELGDHEFNFHLNYAGRSWYPLNDDGLLPLAPEESPVVQIAVADYRKYPKTTKVGMRGPMLRLSDVETAPPVYHYEEEFFL